jgi:ADP-ribose pyrophosphatase YjhB (NUDIX family)
MNVLPLLDELRAIAVRGLEYENDPNARERYERILELVDSYYGEAFDLPPEHIRERFEEELGYVTAKVSVAAAIFDDDGRILLMKHSNSGEWGLPGGFVDPNESVTDAVVRETREETGFDIRIVELIGVYSLLPNTYPIPHSQAAIIYQCSVIGGTLRLSHEGDALRYRSIDNVTDWYLQAQKYATEAHKMWLNERDTNPK